jgi:hypothetical protein
MGSDKELHPLVEGLASIVALVVAAVANVVAIGGIWAAWSGNSFLFWEFSDGSPVTAFAILVFGEPLIMTVAYWVYLLLGLLLALPIRLISALFGRRN